MSVVPKQMDGDLRGDLFAQQSHARNQRLAICPIGAIAPATVRSRMKKRLRRKKHVCEFQEFGFEVEIGLRPGMNQGEVHAFTDRFIAIIEAHQLAFGGGIGATVSGFVTRFERGSEDRACVIAFLASDFDVVRHEIGELRDAWYE